MVGESLHDYYEAILHSNIIHAGLVSGQIVLPLAVWIAIQVGYILFAVLFPFFFKRLSMNKKRVHILHIVSLLIGLMSLVIPSVLIQTLGGYGLIDTLFPPIVCFPTNRDVNAYTVLIPLGIFMAVIITLLVLILHRLIRYFHTYFNLIIMIIVLSIVGNTFL